MTAPAPRPARPRVRPLSAALLLAGLGVVAAALAVVAAGAGPLHARPTPVSAPPTRVAVPVSMPSLPVRGAAGGRGPEWFGTALMWIGAVAGVLVALAIVWWLTQWLRRPRRPRPVAPSDAPPATLPAMMTRLAGPAAADLGAGRTFRPRLAADEIIAAWETVEEAAAAIGHRRRASSTPTEFLGEVVAAAGEGRVAGVTDGSRVAGVTDDSRLARVTDDGAVHGPMPDVGQAASATLLGLYHRARFDTGALTVGGASAARAAARALIAAWTAGDGAAQ